MKLLIIFLAITFASTILADEATDWLQFKMKFGKLFLSPGKEAKRRAAFTKHKANFDGLKAAAAAGDISYTPAIYAFHDLEPEDMLARMTGFNDAGKGGDQQDNDDEEGDEEEDAESRAAPPANYDARDVIAFTPVKNQQQCGSCWTFSTISAVEVGYAQHYGQAVVLSEQHLVDCGDLDSAGNATDGCQGGYPPNALTFLAENGGAIEDYLYPYTALFGTCMADGKPRKQLVAGYLSITANVTAVQNAIMTYGSLCIGVDASKWSYYGGGIFHVKRAGSPNHAVAVVGWGYDAPSKQNFWIVRNSWGSTWGENGYIRLLFGSTGTYNPQNTWAAKLSF